MGWAPTQDDNMTSFHVEKNVGVAWFFQVPKAHIASKQKLFIDIEPVLLHPFVEAKPARLHIE